MAPAPLPPAFVEAIAGGVRDTARVLDDRQRALLGLCVASCVSVLDREAMRRHAGAAIEAGASQEELTETLVLASVIGMHALIEGVPAVVAELDAAGRPAPPAPDAEREALRGRWVGDDPYWGRFEAELPGVVDGLLALSPPAFDAFFSYSGLPWRSNHLPGALKELMYVAVDAVPNHVYPPGLRLHAANAAALGASPEQLAEAIVLAAMGDAPTVDRVLGALRGAPR